MLWSIFFIFLFKTIKNTSNKCGQTQVNVSTLVDQDPQHCSHQHFRLALQCPLTRPSSLQRRRHCSPSQAQQGPLNLPDGQSTAEAELATIRTMVTTARRANNPLIWAIIRMFFWLKSLLLSFLSPIALLYRYRICILTD